MFYPPLAVQLAVETVRMRASARGGPVPQKKNVARTLCASRKDGEGAEKDGEQKGSGSDLRPGGRKRTSGMRCSLLAVYWLVDEEDGDRLVDVPVAAHPLVLHDRSCLAWIHRTKSDQWFGGVAPDVFLASEAGTSIIASSSTKTCHHRQKKSATPFSVRLLEN